jgi:hypothetical protein
MPAKQGANRTTWKPGQSGNPAGRPRSGLALAEVLRCYLDEPLKTGDRKRKLIERLYSMATSSDSGSVAAMRLLIETANRNELEERVIALEEMFAKKGKGLA